jgi:hypothetical protein
MWKWLKRRLVLAAVFAIVGALLKRAALDPNSRGTA